MSIPNKYRDSDKSLNYSAEDYVTLSNYHTSFFSASKLSQLRLAIAPGTVKYFNKAFDQQRYDDAYIAGVQDDSGGIRVSEYALTPIPSRSNNNTRGVGSEAYIVDTECEYATYPSLR